MMRTAAVLSTLQSRSLASSERSPPRPGAAGRNRGCSPCSPASVADLPIVRPVNPQEVLVGHEERLPVFTAAVPYQYHRAARLQNACELPARLSCIEPVKGLSRGYEVHATVRQCGVLRRGRHARKPPEVLQSPLPGPAHLLVRLDGENPVAVRQEQPRERPGPGSRPRNPRPRSPSPP